MKELAGKIRVDSGMILIGDPSYLHRPEVADGLQAAMTGRQTVDGAQPVTGGNWDVTLGLLVRTFWGDGLYPVWIETEGVGRIRTVTIDFHP